MNNTTDGPQRRLPVIAANDNLTIVGNGDTIERSTAAGTPDFRLLAVASWRLADPGELDAAGRVWRRVLWAGGGRAAAIYNQGSLVLNGVTVQGNTANYQTAAASSLGWLGHVGRQHHVQNNVAQAGFAPATTGIACGGGLCSRRHRGHRHQLHLTIILPWGGRRLRRRVVFLSGTSTVNNATVDNNAVDRLTGCTRRVDGFYSGPGGYGGGLYFQSHSP